MKSMLFTLLIVSSLLICFLFAGVTGAFISGSLISLAWVIHRKRERGNAVYGSISRLVIFSFSAYVIMMMFGLVGAHQEVKDKVSGIRSELLSQGYHPKWVIISQKRYDYYNDILRYSLRNGKSKHITGKAMDLFILDIDGNWKYDKNDYFLLKSAAIKCERVKPISQGKTYSYFGKGYFTQHMVHIEVE